MGIEFNDLTFGPHSSGYGIRARMFFPNGYGVSVVRSRFSYGGEDGLYELAVMARDDEKHSLTYATPITDDVLGHLTEDDVTDAMRRVAALPERVTA